MFRNVLIASLAIDVVLSGVVKNVIPYCSYSEFSCPDETCVSLQRVCDGVSDCTDGSDEAVCLPGANSSLALGDVFSRAKRQSGCRRDEWQCRDGSCIQFFLKCDGGVDCPDRSDETHALCRNFMCQDNLFRCAYGACVDGTAPCNGVQECADNSDELQPKCRNETRVFKGQFKCDNGQEISAVGLCDGEPNCQDGSDEKLEVCAGKTCASYLFQCAYGACVDGDSDCNGRQECADGSDEADDLCNRTSTAVVTFPPPVVPTPPPSSEGCRLPPFPINGRYEVQNRPTAKPGQPFDKVHYIHVNCDPGYAVKGNNSRFIFCSPGLDVASLVPKCERYCKLDPDPSVEYSCKTKTSNSETPLRLCDTREFVGTVVVPTCRAPNYRGSPAYMTCSEIGWNHVAKCNPGLAKNGTNITILVKDKIELYISNFEYSSDIAPGRVSPSRTSNIDEMAWRFGTTDKSKKNNIVTHIFTAGNEYVSDKETLNVIVKIENGKVKITVGDTVLSVGN